ncbi:hypothetical protein [Thalassotalea atypica]|uniref:hypothetical protein n=1 Tax=Thalassotalea atypica TaxID=2054316 RepID=UPI00257272FD|nr:hypothetical protein [Thalassotalea atypica]
MNDIEQLLSKPLPEIEPEDFSAQVIKKIQRIERFSTLLVLMMYAVVTGVLLLMVNLLPIFEFTIASKLELFNKVDFSSFLPTVEQSLLILQNPMSALVTSTVVLIITLIKFEI